MKKLFTYAAGAALAVASVPVLAGGDPGNPVPPDTDVLQEFINAMCAVTGWDFYCDRATVTLPGVE